MPIYIAKSYLVHKGKVVQTDGKVELTEEQAKRLGNKVELFEDSGAEGENADDKYTESSLKKLSADEQKAIVEDLEGDLEEITNEEKRIAYILENQE